MNREAQGKDPGYSGQGCIYRGAMAGAAKFHRVRGIEEGEIQDQCGRFSDLPQFDCLNMPRAGAVTRFTSNTWNQLLWIKTVTRGRGRRMAAEALPSIVRIDAVS